MAKKTDSQNPEKFPNIGEKLWQELINVDPKYTKQFTRNGFTGTSISHVHGRMVMTKLFGPHGLGWGFTASNFVDDGESVTCDGYLWYRPYYVDDSYPWDLVCDVNDSGSIGKMMENEDGTKRPTTDPKKGATRDAMNACLMALGHGANIYAGLLDPPAPPGKEGDPPNTNGQPGNNTGTQPTQGAGQGSQPKTGTSAGNAPPPAAGKNPQPAAPKAPPAEKKDPKAPENKEPPAQLSDSQQAVLTQLTQQHKLLKGCDFQFVDEMLWFKIKTPTNQTQLKELQTFGFQPRGNGHLYYGVSLKAA